MNGIFKFQPGSKFTVKKSSKLFVKKYYLNYENIPSLISLKDDFDKNFRNQFQLLKKEKVVLFFSGGRDSLLIFKYLLQMKINFECVFYDTSISSVISNSNYFVKNICNQNQIKLRIIKIPLLMQSDFKNFYFQKCYLIIIIRFCILQLFKN